MSKNLSEELERFLPTDILGFIKKAAEIAADRGERLYLVGGAVRDLLLGRQTMDIDLSVEGDAIGLAQKIAAAEGLIITSHKQFNTARFVWGGRTIDLATARTETYPRPGALPVVSPGGIGEDLFRRDFTINAMAITLNKDDCGRLIDPHNGQRDLGDALIRIIHPRSFLDDSTRIWRGLRYEQRLGFRLETETLRLLKRDVPCLDTVTGERIFYELECALKEEAPEGILRRAGELGVLQRINPALTGNAKLGERFRRARALPLPELSSIGLYLALLACDLSREQKEKLIAYLNLDKSLARAIVDVEDIKAGLQRLSRPDLKPSAVHHLLNGLSVTAITAGMIVTDSAVAKANIGLYLDKLRRARTLLTGDDLLNMGVPEGPRIKEVLGRLLDARLDGRVKTMEDEERLARDCLTE